MLRMPKIVDHHRRREDLALLTLRVIGAVGIENAAVREIARRGALSLGSLTHYFTSKDDLVAAYGRLEKLCGYVHLPMQSGSDRILRAMNRPYTRERYREIVDALRARGHRRRRGLSGGLPR